MKFSVTIKHDGTPEAVVESLKKQCNAVAVSVEFGADGISFERANDGWRSFFAPLDAKYAPVSHGGQGMAYPNPLKLKFTDERGERL